MFKILGRNEHLSSDVKHNFYFTKIDDLSNLTPTWLSNIRDSKIREYEIDDIHIVSMIFVNCLFTFRLNILIFSLTTTVILMVTAIDSIWFKMAVKPSFFFVSLG